MINYVSLSSVIDNGTRDREEERDTDIHSDRRRQTEVIGVYQYEVMIIYV